uniref:Leucine rich repeats and calponin homology domain containing 3 n=1 Tax=Leptobrachium leishanense TaxID=445787 RepID=A0A8C5QQE0_9ANUR
MAAAVLAEGSAVASAGLSGIIHNGHGGGAAASAPGGLGPAAWNRSLERALEEAAVTGMLNLSGRKLREFPRSAARQDLSDTTQAEMLKDFGELPGHLCEVSRNQWKDRAIMSREEIPSTYSEWAPMHMSYLSRNRLSEVPAEICHYISLESLNLYQNCIRYVPEATLNLQALTFLNISRNQLTSLPGYLCSLPLKVLVASNNKLDSLPEDISSLRHLTELDVSCNEIQNLPSQIGKLESLRDFNIRRNHLVQLPEELAELPLVRLDFSCNRVTVIPVCYRNLRHLQTITLDNNPLQSPPAQICIKGKIHIFKYLNIEACKSAPDLPDYERRPHGFGTCPEEVYPGRPYGALDSGFNSVDSGDKRWSGNEPTEEFSDVSLRSADQNRDLRTRRDAQPQEQKGNLFIPNGGVEHDLEQIDYIDSYAAEEEDDDSRLSRGNSLSSQFMAYIEERRVSHGVSPSKQTPTKGCHKPESQRTMLDANYLLSVANTPSQTDADRRREMLENTRREAQVVAQQYEEERKNSRLAADVQRHNAQSSQKLSPQSSENGFEPHFFFEIDNNTNTIKRRPGNHMQRDEQSSVPSASPASQTISNRCSPQRPESFLFRAAVREEAKRGNTPPPAASSSESANPRTLHRPKLRQEEVEMTGQLRKNIESRLKVSLPDDLGAALTDGVVLCHLANHVRPRSVPSIHVPSPAVPKLTMAKCRRNVENFLEACKKIGVPQDRLCLPPHILEETGLVEVAGTVQALLDLAPPKHLSPTTV